MNPVNVMTILPTAAGAREWPGRIPEGGAVFGHAAVSVNQFVRLAVMAARPDRVWLTAGEQLAAIAGVVDDFYGSRPDAPFAGLRRRTGYWRSLQSFVGECRRACIVPGELTETLTAGGVPEPRADMLGQLYAGYADRMAALNATDNQTAEWELAGILKDSFAKMTFFDDIESVDIRGVYDIKPATFEWILELSRHIPTTVYFPLPKDHPRSIRWLVWAYGKFEYLAEHGPEGLEVSAEDLQAGRALTPLLPRLFRPVAQLKKDGMSLLDSSLPIRVMEAADPRREIRETARKCRGLIDAGASPDRIAVVVRRPEMYPNAPDEFEAFGVPVDLSTAIRETWFPDDAEREALDFAALAAEGFQREDLIGWLGHTRCEISESLRHPDLPRFLRESGLMSGAPDAIRDRLNNHAAGSPAADRRIIRRIAADLHDLLNGAEALSEPQTPARYFSALRDRLATVGLFRAPYLDRAPDLSTAFHRMAMVVEPWNEKLDPHVLLDLAGRLSSGGGRTDGGVRLISVTDLPGLDVDHLFLPGLLSGIFPAEPKQEVFLKDGERMDVMAAYAKRNKDRWGPSLAGHRVFDTAHDERLRENFLFFLCLSLPRLSVTLSYPRMDAQGRPATSSSFLDEIMKQFEKPEEIRIAPAEEPRTRAETDADAIRRIDAGDKSILVSDPARMAMIAGRLDIERRRERFFVERDRDARARMAFEHTGRLTTPGPYWTRPDMPARTLESFAGCPFKGFAGDILRLKEIDRPEEGYSAKEFGILLHAFMELFWRRMMTEHPGGPANSGAAMATARKISQSVFDEACALLPDSGHPLRSGLRASLKHVIESAVDLVRGDVAAGYWAEAVEETVTTTATEGGIKLSGRIDRLDRGPNRVIRIVDYKLSAAQSLRDKKKSLWTTDIQLAVYALAASERWAAGDDDEISLMFISLRHAAEPIEMWSGPVRELRALFDPATALKNITAGKFDVTPADPSLCGMCEARRACRVLPVLDDVESEGD